MTVTGLTAAPLPPPGEAPAGNPRPGFLAVAESQPVEPAPDGPATAAADPVGAAPTGDGAEAPLPTYGNDVPDYDQPALFDPLTPRPWVRYSARPTRPAPEDAPPPPPKPASAPPTLEPARAERTLAYAEAPDPDTLGRTLDPNARFYEAAVPPVIPDGSPPFSGNEEFAIQSGGRSFLPRGRLLLRLSTGAIFDDNVALRDRGRKSDFVFTLSPSITYALGSGEGRFSLLVNYNPTALLYAKGTADNAVDHAGLIALRYRFTKLTLGATFVARSLTGSSRDAGDRVSRTLFYLGGSANYLYNEKLSFDLNGDLAYSDFKGLLGSDEARVQGFVNFAVRPKLQLGAGFLFGVLSVDRGPTQTYEQLLARVIYAPTVKLGFNASAGLEVRQLGSGVSDQLAPVLSLGAGYEPWVNTNFTLDARHRTYPSTALRGQDYQSTGLTFGVRRSNIADRFTASLVLGYEHTGYEETTRGGQRDPAGRLLLLPGRRGLDGEEICERERVLRVQLQRLARRRLPGVPPQPGGPGRDLHLLTHGPSPESPPPLRSVPPGHAGRPRSPPSPSRCSPRPPRPRIRPRTHAPPGRGGKRPPSPWPSPPPRRGGRGVGPARTRRTTVCSPTTR